MFKWAIWIGLSLASPVFFFIWMGALVLGSIASGKLREKGVS